jgi:hypothetical protein
MNSPFDLQRLAQDITPSDAIKSRIGLNLASLAKLQTPSSSLRTRIFENISSHITPQIGVDLKSLVSGIRVPNLHFLREVVLLRLAPRRSSFFGHWFKWSFALALLLVVVRLSPFVFTAPSLRAQTGVYLLPKGDVSVLHGSLWETVDHSTVLTRATTVRTGPEGSATVILSDDGVIRLAGNTQISLEDLSDRPLKAHGTTASFDFGQIWVFGLVPTFVDGLSLQTRLGLVSVNEGSLSLYDDGIMASLAAYDRGATLVSPKKTLFIIAPERVSTRGSAGSLALSTSTKEQKESTWVQQNLEQDAAHRSDLVKLLSERKKNDAAILPSSLLYPAKRFAEEVDVFFAFSSEEKSTKRLAQANSRLHEAFVLLNDGKATEAQIPFSEYRSTLLALASSSQDNLVQSLIREQIVSASASLLDGDQTASGSVRLLTSAVSEVSAILPNANLRAEDIEGYILIDRLSRIHKNLKISHYMNDALAEYDTIRPYLSTLLKDQSSTNTLLKKEATSLLVSLSDVLPTSSLEDAARRAISTDIAQYLPQEKEEVLVSEAELTAQVQAMMSRIFVFRHPRSRYNQLLVEMTSLAGNARRGTLLRRLKVALPDALGEYVNTEVKKLGDELKAKEE